MAAASPPGRRAGLRLPGRPGGHSAGMPITVSARRTGGPLRCEVELPGGRTIVTDEPAELGGEDTAPTPQALLAAALAACVVTTVQMYADRKGWRVGDFRVEVEYLSEPRPRCARVTLCLPDGLPAEQRQRLRDVAGRCPVSRALAEGLEIGESALP